MLTTAPTTALPSSRDGVGAAASTPSSHRRVVVGDLAVDLALSGRPEGRTALVLHGLGGPGDVAGVVGHLGKTHRVLAPTHPGWGSSERVAGLNCVGALSRAYLDLLAAEGARDVLVVGACFGGWVGAQMALDDDAGRIGALVLLGAIGVRVPGEAVVLPAVDAVDAVDAAPAGGRRWAPLSGALGAYAGPVAHEPALIHRLGAVRVPALVVWGREDDVAHVAYGRAWAQALGRGDLAVIEGAGHLPFLAAPGATFAAIDAFLPAALPVAA